MSKTLYDITFIDIPVKKFNIEDKLSKKLNNMYFFQNEIFKRQTGYEFEEKKYYYTSGILCLSTYLKERNFKVGYINYPKDKSKFIDMISKSKYIGFSTVTITIDTILNLARKIKILNPNIKILLGGYHASYCAQELLENNQALDGIIIGEGEETLAKILSGIEMEKIEGFAYIQSNGEYHINKRIHFLKEEDIPSPDFSLIESDLENYNIYIATMRGCIGKCNFCVNHNYWGKPRYISLNKIEDTFRYLYERINDLRLIHIIDNVFTLDIERLKKIKHLLNPYKSKFIFECDTLASLIDEQRVRLLQNMNIVKIGLGFEDCSDIIGKIAQKGVTISDNIKAAKTIRKYAPNICVYAYWLIGLPGTSINSVNQNIKMIRNLISREIVHIISPKIFIPYPGTNFWKKSREYNLYISSKSWSNYERISPPYPYHLKNFTEKQLEKALEDIIDVCNDIGVKSLSIAP
ncbi:B12 binding domain protein [Eubacteriaceae bacterium CHKCI004]|nr:B12 binding domain protein [Eubacteriaceae bacterium CHKCI004]